MRSQWTDVVFDLDGTLVDSAPDITRSINRMLEARGLQPLSRAVVTKFIGDGSRTLVGRCLAQAGAAATPEEIDDAYRQYGAFYSEAPVVESTLYPDVGILLAELGTRGFRCFLCTNKSERLARQVLSHFDIVHHFAAVIGSDSSAYHKPAAELLTEVLELDGFGTLVFGDSRHDRMLARNAHAFFVLSGYGYVNFDPDALGVEAIANRPMELLNWAS